MREFGQHFSTGNGGVRVRLWTGKTERATAHWIEQEGRAKSENFFLLAILKRYWRHDSAWQRVSRGLWSFYDHFLAINIFHEYNRSRLRFASGIIISTKTKVYLLSKKYDSSRKKKTSEPGTSTFLHVPHAPSTTSLPPTMEEAERKVGNIIKKLLHPDHPELRYACSKMIAWKAKVFFQLGWNQSSILWFAYVVLRTIGQSQSLFRVRRRTIYET